MTTTSTGPGPATLSRDAILDAALELVEREGVGAVTVRRLGRILGRDPTALYRHYRDKDDLVSAIADHLLGTLLEGFEPSESWQDTIRDLAWRTRRMYLTHPSFGRVLGHAPNTLVNNARAFEELLRALSKTGLPDPEIGNFADSLIRWIIAVSIYDTEAGKDEVPSSFGEGLDKLPGQHFGYCVRFAPHMLHNADTAFNLGLDTLISAIAAAAPARPQNQPADPS